MSVGETPDPADDDLLFGDEDDEAIEPAVPTAPQPRRTPWRVLIVDDDNEVHAVSRLVLKDVTVDGSPLEILSAHSGAEARARFREHADIAVVLLDVVMETDCTGLEVARCIRHEIGNHAVRVVLRTGQPGRAPERQIIRDYDINDYWSKTELTADRLRTVITGGIRSYRDIHTIERHRTGLGQIIEATALLFQTRALDHLIEATLTQLSTMLKPHASAVFFHCRRLASDSDETEVVVGAGTGHFAGTFGRPAREVLSAEVWRDAERSAASNELVLAPTYGLYMFGRGSGTSDGPRSGIFMEDIGELNDWERKIVSLFLANASSAYANQWHHEQALALNRSTSRFVPHEFLKLLGHESLLTMVRGNRVRREMSIVFLDIRDFTPMIEAGTPDEGFDFVNEYLGYMEPALRGHGGLIASYEGDAIIALFPGDADDAVRAGLASLDALARYNEHRRTQGQRSIAIGVGINTGMLMLGIMGSEQRLQCSVIGDPVNLASRIESLTKFYGVTMLVSEYTLARLADRGAYRIRAIDRVLVKGRTGAVTLYEALDGLEPAARDRKLATRETFEAAWGLFRRGEIGRALEGFEAVALSDPSDRVAQLYVGRCRRYAEAGVPAGWDGVMTLAEK